jgi:sugar lactone lactonase YvrE
MISPRSELLPAFESRVAHESISEIAVSGVVALARLFLSPHCAQADIVFVSNYTNNTIEVFNSSGQQSAVVSNGLSGPTGLAFNGGNLYVANRSNNTIEVFNSAGHGSVFTSSGLNEPVGLAFDKSGNLYVANDGDNTIEKFNSTGQGTVFASTGVSGPTGLAFDTNGNLFVANTLGNTIEKFNSSGVGTVFANLASGLDDPVGLAFDTKGNLYVSNVGVDPPFANAITKFTPGGVVTNFASGLNQPAGLAFDSSGNLYVANSGAATIVKYTSNGSGSTFASSGLYAPLFIAIQVPEPATWILVAFGIGAFLGGCHLRRRSP